MDINDESKISYFQNTLPHGMLMSMWKMWKRNGRTVCNVHDGFCKQEISEETCN